MLSSLSPLSARIGEDAADPVHRISARVHGFRTPGDNPRLMPATGDSTHRSLCMKKRGIMLSAGPVILASASAARREMLEAAGLDVRCSPVAVDEEEIRRSLEADGASAAEAAVTLAEHKAARAASQLGAEAAGVPVIGADQILDCNGIWFAKPPDRDHARAQLLSLRGRTHTLVSGVCVVRNGVAIWHHVAEARLRMRPFSDAFADRYLDAMGDCALATVGGYELEGLGSHLFDRVDGDWFTILGMPLLPLLDHLRLTGILLA